MNFLKNIIIIIGTVSWAGTSSHAESYAVNVTWNSHIHQASSASAVSKIGRQFCPKQCREAARQAAQHKAATFLKKAERLGGDIVALAYDIYDEFREAMKTADRKKIEQLTKELEAMRKQLAVAKNQNDYLQAKYEVLSVQIIELLKLLDIQRNQVDIMM